jgi:hypothetical protein
LKGFFEELDVPLDQLGKYVLVVIQFREGFLHSVGGAQFAAHLLLDVSPKLWESFVTQALGEAYYGRLTDPYGSGEIAYIGEQKSGAVGLQVMAKALLCAVERVDLG